MIYVRVYQGLTKSKIKPAVNIEIYGPMMGMRLQIATIQLISTAYGSFRMKVITT